MKLYSQKIKALEERISQLKDSVLATTKSVEEGKDLSDEQSMLINEAQAEIEKAQRNIETFQNAEKAMSANLSAPAVVKAGNIQDKERPKADLLIKQATATLVGHLRNAPAEVVAESLYQKDAGAVDFIKATVNPATTTTAGWAAELVQEQYGQFMEALRPLSVYSQVAAMGTSIPFGGGNSVTFPAEGTTGGLAGSFVGEGNLIPVKKGNFTSAVVNRYKMAVISNFTSEILRSSTPSIEALVRDIILKDTAESIDSAFFGSGAAKAGIRPAGLLNGVTGTATAGNTVANIVTDIKALVSPIIAAGGNSNGIVLVMNEEHLLGLQTVTTAAGTFAFRSDLASGNLLGYKVVASNTIPKGTVASIYAPAIASAFDAPSFETSNSAVIIQASDTGAKPVVGDYDTGDGHTVGAAVNDATNNPSVTTMFQQDMIALRMIMPLSWVMRRANMVQSVTAVKW